jgi:hypothetical protein
MIRSSRFPVRTVLLVTVVLAGTGVAGAGPLFVESRHEAKAGTRAEDGHNLIPVRVDDELESVESPSLAPASVEVDASVLEPAMFFTPTSKSRAAALRLQHRRRGAFRTRPLGNPPLAATPEPSAFVLFAVVGLGFATARRLRRKAR